MNPKGLYTGPDFSPAILYNYTVMVGDAVHLPRQVGGQGSLESKVNPKGLYGPRVFWNLPTTWALGSIEFPNTGIEFF